MPEQPIEQQLNAWADREVAAATSDALSSGAAAVQLTAAPAVIQAAQARRAARERMQGVAIGVGVVLAVAVVFLLLRSSGVVDAFAESIAPAEQRTPAGGRED